MFLNEVLRKSDILLLELNLYGDDEGLVSILFFLNIDREEQSIKSI